MDLNSRILSVLYSTVLNLKDACPTVLILFLFKIPLSNFLDQNTSNCFSVLT